MSTGTTSGSGRKRQRKGEGDEKGSQPQKIVNHACVSCKLRKVRCDAKRPRCTYCSTHRWECEYSTVFKRATCAQSYVEDLEATVREYEKTVGLRPLPQRRTGDDAVNVSPEAKSASPPSAPRQLPQPTDRPSYSFIPPSNAQFTNPAAFGGTDAGEQILSTNSPFRESLSSRGDTTLQGRRPPTEGISAVRDSPVSNGESNAPREIVNEDSPALFMDGMVEYSSISPERCERDTLPGESLPAHFAFDIQIMSQTGTTTFNTSHPELVNQSLMGKNRQMTTSVRDVAGSLHPKDTGVYEYEDLKFLQPILNSSEFQCLPLRWMAQRLFDRYFRLTNPIWPVLIEKEARAQFDTIWSSSKPQDPVLIAQVNMVMALACLFHEEDTETSHDCLSDVLLAGERFYRRAKVVVAGCAFSVCSLQMLQNLLLLAQYQQGTMRSNQCWLTVGHATRMAENLGLHRRTSDKLPISPLQKELRKRLWCCCFVLDRMSSMVYGRPPGILATRNELEANLPTAIDDSFIDEKLPQPPNLPSEFSFLGFNVKLFSMVVDILETVRKNKAGQGNTQAMTTKGTYDHRFNLALLVLQLDREFLDWHSSLIEHLQFPLDRVAMDDTLPPQLQRQRNILNVRFLGFRMHLHRQTLLYLLQQKKLDPPFSKAVQSQPAMCPDPAAIDSSFTGRRDGAEGWSNFDAGANLVNISATICVMCAELQIELIETVQPMERLGAWWWSFHYTFNALCVLCAAMTLHTRGYAGVVRDRAKVRSTIDKGLQILRGMQPRGGDRVVQSVNFLQQLLLSGETKRYQPASGTEAACQEQQGHPLTENYMVQRPPASANDPSRLLESSHENFNLNSHDMMQASTSLDPWQLMMENIRNDGTDPSIIAEFPDTWLDFDDGTAFAVGLG